MSDRHIIVTPNFVSIEIVSNACQDCDELHYSSAFTFYPDDEEDADIITVFTNVFSDSVDDAIYQTVNAANVLYGDAIDDEIIIIHEGEVEDETISLQQWVNDNLIPKNASIN